MAEMKTLQDYIDKLNSLNFKDMYNGDFFLTWEKTDEELEAVFTLADACLLYTSVSSHGYVPDPRKNYGYIFPYTDVRRSCL